MDEQGHQSHDKDQPNQLEVFWEKLSLDDWEQHATQDLEHPEDTASETFGDRLGSSNSRGEESVANGDDAEKI